MMCSIKMPKCGCCGNPVFVLPMGDSYTVWGPDLDSRPAPSERFKITVLLQECKSCGYVNFKIQEKIDGIIELVKSKQYKECNSFCTNNELTKKYIRWGMICSEKNDLEEETKAYLRAAWTCDDAKEIDCAIQLRRKSEILVHKLIDSGNDDPIYQLMDLDLLRRTSQFDKVENRFLSMNINGVDQKLVDAMYFEVEKSKEHDTRRYRFGLNDVIEQH